jgi:phospholipase C
LRWFLITKPLSLVLVLATTILSLSILVSSGLKSVTTNALSISVLHGSNNATTTPIKHIVILVQEDIAFDHYFGTYPNATNSPGEPKFVPSQHNPSINGLNSNLLYKNPNSVNPIRLDRTPLLTCSMNHNYTSE